MIGKIWCEELPTFALHFSVKQNYQEIKMTLWDMQKEVDIYEGESKV